MSVFNEPSFSVTYVRDSSSKFNGSMPVDWANGNHNGPAGQANANSNWTAAWANGNSNGKAGWANGNSNGKAGWANGNSSGSASYRTEEQQPLVETLQSATYIVPGSAAVQVSGTSMAKTIANLRPGDNILGISLDTATGNALVWAALQQIEVVPNTSMFHNRCIVGLGGDDSASLKAEQAVLTGELNKKIVIKPACRLEIGVDSVVAFNANSLPWQGKKAQEVKKVSSLQLVHDKDPITSLYKLTVGSTDHSLLMSCAQDSRHFLVVSPLSSAPQLQVGTNGTPLSIQAIPFQP